MKVQLLSIPEIIGPEGVFIDGDWVESKDQDKNGSVRLIQLADIGENAFLDKSKRHLTKEKAIALRCTFLRKGDLLLARMPDPMGRCCIFPGLEQESVTVVDVCIIRPANPDINNVFLMHLINNSLIRHQINKFTTGTTRSRISRGNLSKIKLPIPHIDDQIRIATLLSRVEALIATRKENLRQLDEFLKSAFLEMFGILNGNFKAWKIEKLMRHTDIVSGVTKGKKYKNEVLVEIPYMRVANVQDGFLDLNDIKTIMVTNGEIEKYKLIKGDVLLTEGGDPDKLGRGAVWENQIEICIHQNHIFRVRVVDCKELNPSYLSALVGSIYGKSYFLKAAKQTTGIASINSTQLKNFPLIIAPIKLQNDYAKIAAKSERLKILYRQNLTELENLYGALSQKFFKGELDLSRIPYSKENLLQPRLQELISVPQPTVSSIYTLKYEMTVEGIKALICDKLPRKFTPKMLYEQIKELFFDEISTDFGTIKKILAELLQEDHRFLEQNFGAFENSEFNDRGENQIYFSVNR